MSILGYDSVLLFYNTNNLNIMATRKIYNELKVLKDNCTTKEQRRAFNKLVKSLSKDKTN